jgi:putative ABC transport system ATP-binding protein
VPSRHHPPVLVEPEADRGRRISTSEGERGISVSPASLVLLQDVGKIFYTDEVETHALSDINLELRRGEYISIVGPSGGGKSTLLSIIGLLESPTHGEYILGGTPVSHLSLTERARIRNREIGFIFQAFNLIGDLNVYDNVELPLTYHDMSAKERRDRVEEALLKVGMSHRMKHYPSQLSGGQQQRVAVARAVAGNPSILLADEPTGNLDSTNGEAVMHLLNELHAGGATICMVTHDPRYAKYAGRAIHLFDGHIEEERIREATDILLPHGFY